MRCDTYRWYFTSIIRLAQYFVFFVETVDNPVKTLLESWHRRRKRSKIRARLYPTQSTEINPKNCGKRKSKQHSVRGRGRQWTLSFRRCARTTARCFEWVIARRPLDSVAAHLASAATESGQRLPAICKAAGRVIGFCTRGRHSDFRLCANA